MKFPTHEVLQHLIVRLHAHDSAITFTLIKDTYANVHHKFSLTAVRGRNTILQSLDGYSFVKQCNNYGPNNGRRDLKEKWIKVRGWNVEGRGQRSEMTIGK